MNKLIWRLAIGFHLILVVAMYMSPFWLGWKIIAVLVVLSFVQQYLFGDCILSIYQFKSKQVGFQEWLLSKIGIHVNRSKFRTFAVYHLPFIVLGIALLWQVGLGVPVLVG